MRGEADDHGARSVQERARLQTGGGARGGDRTLNMWFMAVTLEVSKLSGWLKADARCRESKGEGKQCGAS